MGSDGTAEGDNRAAGMNCIAADGGELIDYGNVLLAEGKAGCMIFDATITEGDVTATESSNAAAEGDGTITDSIGLTANGIVGTAASRCLIRAQRIVWYRVWAHASVQQRKMISTIKSSAIYISQQQSITHIIKCPDKGGI